MQRQLVERAIAGDFDAFEALVNRSASRQYSIASLILRDPDRAHDAVQDALVAAWRGLSALRDPDAWDAWVNRLTVRACYTAVRRYRRLSLFELPASPDLDVADAADAPEAVAERDLMERKLGRLPIDQRTVVVLHFYVGLPLVDVAMVLGVPAATVRSKLHRALGILRISMASEPATHTNRPEERPA